MTIRSWASLAIFLYTVVFYLLIPAILLKLVWRGLRSRGYWQRWGERFGHVQPEADALRDPIWIHAVSVGEVQAAIPLVRALIARYPQRSIVFTTTTATGSARVRSSFGDTVFHAYFPFDLPGPVRRFLDATRPQLAIVMETELWPNTMRACAARGVPLIVANARLSDKSRRRYRRMRPVLGDLLRHVYLVAARGPRDAERFRELGAPAEKVSVVGNLKFDLEISDALRPAARELRRQWGESRPVWIAGSTHEGEESLVLDSFRKVRERTPGALLILVPRHPERFDRVAQMCRAAGFATVRRSRKEQPDRNTDVVLGDTMGEMMLLYAASDVAFVGGSLVAVGGHNMLEPAALGLPVVVGPHLHNFEEVADALLTARAMVRVPDGAALGESIGALLRDAGEREPIGRAGRSLIDRNRGALERLLDIVDSALRDPASHGTSGTVEAPRAGTGALSR